MISSGPNLNLKWLKISVGRHRTNKLTGKKNNYKCNKMHLLVFLMTSIYNSILRNDGGGGGCTQAVNEQQDISHIVCLEYVYTAYYCPSQMNLPNTIC